MTSNTLMYKVIRFDKKNCVVREKYNNFYYMFEKLALAKKMKVLNRIPKKRELRTYLINKYEKNNHEFKLSNKDFKRLERPRKYELPVNVVDILELFLDEVIKNKENFDYKCNDSEIVSIHMIKNSIDLLNVLIAFLDDPDNSSAEAQKYAKSVEYVKSKLQNFDQKHNYTINSILKKKEGK